MLTSGLDSRVLSLRWVIVASLSGMFLLGIAIAAAYFYVDTHNTQEELRDRTLQAQAQVVLDALEQGPGFIPKDMPADWAAAYADPNSAFSFTVYDEAGQAVASSESRQKKAPLPLLGLSSPTDVFGSVILLGPKAEPALAARVPDRKMFIVVSRSNPSEDAVAESVAEEQTEPLILLIPFGVLAAFVVAQILARVLRPVERASKEASEIGPTTLSRRIDSSHLPVEVKPLADAFNGTLDRLAEAYELERRFTANAAHELRTPLAVLTLQLQKARGSSSRPDWSSIDEDLARMKRLVTQLLDLARKEAPRTTPVEVNFSRVLRESVAALLPMAEEAGREIEVEIEDNISVCGSGAEDLRDLCDNLVENALRHGQGPVTVTLFPSAERSAVLLVSDQGRISRRIDRLALFERFKKGSEETDGTGLGLAIVAQVAINFGGSARFAEAAATTIEVDLPLARPSA